MVLINGRTVGATMLDLAALETLRSAFAGEILHPGDKGYDDARAVWNGMIDKHPDLILRCTGLYDVIQAVNFAREQNMPPAIKGGGHNVAGHAVSDGGLMIDMSMMRAVHVDPVSKTAHVEAGAIWSDFEREASVFGLSTTSGTISTTGVAGLTMGGGIGWLVGKYGLTIDNLLSVNIVTADGSFIRASEHEHPDLFWALRGGGGNFGVVTSFEFKLHPVGEVLAGFLAWPASDAREITSLYRTFTENNPEEMTTYLQFAKDPESGQRIIAIAVCYPGDIDEGQRLVDQIREVKSPLVDMVGPMQYRDWQSMFDGEFPHGARYYWKGVLLESMNEDVIDALAEQAAFPDLDSNIVVVEHYRGVMNRVDPRATAFPHRNANYQVVIIGRWNQPIDDERGIGWARRLNQTIEPYSTRTQYLNFQSASPEEQGSIVRASFGSNYERLVSVKQRYDPTNLFRKNNNIAP